MGTPPGGGGVATFGDGFGLSAGRTVTLDVTPTLSGLIFDTEFVYTLGGAGGITAASGTAFTIDLLQTNNVTPTLYGVGHIISTPIGGNPTSFNLMGPAAGDMFTNVTTLAATNTFTAPINIANSELRTTVGDAAFGDPTNTLNIDGGILRASAAALTTGRNINIGPGGATFRPFVAMTLNGNLTGTGEMRRYVTGAFTIGGDGIGFTGDVVNESGTMTLINQGRLGGTGNLDLERCQYLYRCHECQ